MGGFERVKVIPGIGLRLQSKHTSTIFSAKPRLSPMGLLVGVGDRDTAGHEVQGGPGADGFERGGVGAWVKV